MTEPSRPRPVPGPPRPGAAPAPDGPAPAAEPVQERPWAELAARPIAEHIEVFEAEHARLQRELATIDQL